MAFHYSISTDVPSSGTSSARRLAESLTTPLCCLVTGAMRSGLAPTGSFCEIEGDDVDLVALRRPRGDHDLAVVLQAGSGDTDVTLRLPALEVARAWVGDHLERPSAEAVVADGVVRARLRRGALSTVLVDLAGTDVAAPGRRRDLWARGRRRVTEDD